MFKPSMFRRAPFEPDFYDYDDNFNPRLPLYDFGMPSRHRVEYRPQESNIIPRMPWYNYGMPSRHPRPIFRYPLISQASHEEDDTKLQIRLNAKHFSADEIKLKIIDNYIVIHCEHQEKPDEHGSVSREFTRRYPIPDNVEPENVKSSLSKDGVLTITALKNVPKSSPEEGRIVPMVVEGPYLPPPLLRARMRENPFRPTLLDELLDDYPRW